VWAVVGDARAEDFEQKRRGLAGVEAEAEEELAVVIEEGN
jgi:hypothetical protein